MKTKLLKILNWIVWNCQRFVRWVKKMWNRKKVIGGLPTNQIMPYIIVSKNTETLYNVELFNANQNYLSNDSLLFTNGFTNMTYKQLLGSIAYGQCGRIGQIRITVSDKNENFSSHNIILTITQNYLDGSGWFKPISFLLNDNQFQSNQATASCNFELNGLVSVIINKLPPKTAFYFYPMISQ